MFDLAGAWAAVAAELSGLELEVASLDVTGFSRSTRCDGWVVRDVVSHAGLAALQQAEAFRRAVAGRLEPPDYPRAPELDDAANVGQLRRGAAELNEALALLTPGVMAGMVALPFGVVPAAIAIQIPVYEYAFHHNDVAWALHGPTPLPAEVAAHFIGFVPGLAPMLAGGVWEKTDEPPVIGYRLVAPAGMVELVNRGKGFEVADLSPDVPACVIEGDNSSIALFVMGRLPADSPALRVTGDVPAAAGDFKRWFPGP